eukprot:m.350950 g.350950  ORF g.350950 m.350950 type:complete len:1297 (-) comp19894_c0_seq3:68-3958(-)
MATTEAAMPPAPAPGAGGAAVAAEAATAAHKTHTAAVPSAKATVDQDNGRVSDSKTKPTDTSAAGGGAGDTPTPASRPKTNTPGSGGKDITSFFTLRDSSSASLDGTPKTVAAAATVAQGADKGSGSPASPNTPKTGGIWGFSARKRSASRTTDKNRGVHTPLSSRRSSVSSQDYQGSRSRSNSSSGLHKHVHKHKDDKAHSAGKAAKLSDPGPKKKKKKTKTPKKVSGDAPGADAKAPKPRVKKATKRKRVDAPVAKHKSTPEEPPSAFFRFSKEHRPKARKLHPSASIPELLKLVGEQWKALSEEDRQPYEDAYQQDMTRYYEEIKTHAAKSKKGKGKSKPAASSDSDDDDAPILTKKAKAKSKQRAITDMFSRSDGARPQAAVKKLTPEEKTKMEKAKEKLRWKLLSKEERQAELDKRKEQRRLERERLREEKKKEKQAQKERERELQLLKQEENKPREDTELTDSMPLPIGSGPPTRLPPHLFSKTLQVCEFVRTFNQALATDHLKTLTPNKLEEAILNKEDGTVLHFLACLIISLLEIRDGPASCQVESPVGVDLCNLPVRAETASALLSLYIGVMDKAGEVPEDLQKSGALKFLKQFEFSAASPEAMLDIMVFLCNQHFQHAEVMGLVDHAVHRVVEIRKEKWRLLREEQQRRKEQREKEKKAKEKLAKTKGGAAASTTQVKAEPPVEQKPELSADEKLALALAAEEGSLAARVRARRSTRAETKREEQTTEADADEDEADEPLSLDEEMQQQQLVIRSSQLGADRDHRQYFTFGCIRGIWARSLDDTWTLYDDDHVDDLVTALNPRGIREKALKEGLQAHLEDRPRQKFRVGQHEQAPAYDPVSVGRSINEKSVEVLRENFEQFYDQVCAGGFGCGRLDSMVERFRAAKTPADLAACLLDIEEKIDLEFLQPPLGWDKKRGRVDVETPQLGDWREYVRACSTPSEVNLIYELLHESIRWQRSCALIKCKICRKNNNDSEMLLCDGCDRGYHMRCLKPPLFEVPGGDWLCNACKPTSFSGRTGRAKAPVSYKEPDSDEDDFEDSDEEDEEDVSSDEGDEDESGEDSDYTGECDVCGEAGEVLCCDGCPRVFHLECVGLRNTPRGKWFCTTCSTSKGTSKRKSTKAPASGRQAKKSRSSSATSRKRTRRGSGTDGDDEEGDNDTVEKVKKAAMFNSSSRDSRQHQDLKACTAILRQLTRHHDSWPFLVPVNPKQCPDYADFVDTPMDLETVRGKLDSLAYPDAAAFAKDIRLIFSNCRKYNAEESDAGQAGLALGKLFESLYGQLFDASVA